MLYIFSDNYSTLSENSSHQDVIEKKQIIPR